MTNYIVIASLCIVAHRRTRLKRGDIKPESYFERSQIKRLLDMKFIEVYEGELPASEPSKEAELPPAPNGEPAEKPAKSKADLQSELTAKGIAFKVSATKQELLDLLNKPAEEPKTEEPKTDEPKTDDDSLI